jgi:hypothetical protein
MLSKTCVLYARFQPCAAAHAALLMLQYCAVPSRQNTGKRTNSRQSGGGGAEIGSSVMLGRPAAAAALRPLYGRFSVGSGKLEMKLLR